MILADENIDANMVSMLRSHGIKVSSVAENNRGISDAEVIELSKNPPKII